MSDTEITDFFEGWRASWLEDHRTAAQAAGMDPDTYTLTLAGQRSGRDS